MEEPMKDASLEEMSQKTNKNIYNGENIIKRNSSWQIKKDFKEILTKTNQS